MTAVCCAVKGHLFTFGDLEGGHGQLGHRGTGAELVPRLVEALAGMNVVGTAAGHGTQPCGPMQAVSSPSGIEAVCSWFTEGNRVGLCRAWSRYLKG